MKETLDRKFSKLLKNITRDCAFCGREGTDTAHIQGRSYLATRWSIKNVFLLCRNCHQKSHNLPIQFEMQVNKMFPSLMQSLVDVRRNKTDLESVNECLNKGLDQNGLEINFNNYTRK